MSGNSKCKGPGAGRPVGLESSNGAGAGSALGEMGPEAQGVWVMGMPWGELYTGKVLLCACKEEQDGRESGRPVKGCCPCPGKGAGERKTG